MSEEPRCARCGCWPDVHKKANALGPDGRPIPIAQAVWYDAECGNCAATSKYSIGGERHCPAYVAPKEGGGA